jgi:hypothetical protein
MVMGNSGGISPLPFLRDFGAKEGHCAWGLCGKMIGHMVRGHGPQAEDAPQSPPRARTGYPYPTRPTPTPRLADILLSCDRPPSKIISQNVNGRMRYQPPPHPPIRWFLLTPYPPYSRDVRPSRIFWGFMFRAWRLSLEYVSIFLRLVEVQFSYVSGFKPDSPLSHFCAIG